MAGYRPRLIGLLAAHFAARDHLRVQRLKRLLHSVEEQTLRVPFLVSWSAEDCDDQSNSAAAEAQAVIREFEANGVLRAMPRLRGRWSQFQHYARLEEVLRRNKAPDEMPWVFFSDDDDVWHPRRAEEYFVAMKSSLGKAEVAAARAHISPGWGPRLSLDAQAGHISELHRQGQLRLAVYEERPQSGLFGTATGEYFDLAVAFNVFEAFFRNHTERVFANPFADIRFRTCALKWPGGVRRFLPSGIHPDGSSEPEAAWMYYYDRPTMPYTTAPSDEDMQYVCEGLPDVKRIAGMRQTLDCVLFQLAPTQAPLRITSREFAEQLVGFLVEQGPDAVAMALDRCRIHGVEVGD